MDPVSCPDACFDEVSVLDLVMDPWEFDRLGLPEPELAEEESRPVMALELVTDTTSAQEPCGFARYAAPVAIRDGDDTSVDLVYKMSDYVDLDYIDRGEQWTRLFADSATAEAHLAELQSKVELCAAASVNLESVITPVPALTMPDGVAAVGWIRTSKAGPGWREYVADVQAANAVVRIRIVTDGSATEQRFRSLVQAYAGQVEFNTPSPGEGAR